MATLEAQAREVIPVSRVFTWPTWLRYVPLAVILVAQAVASARIMVGQVAGPDEARYIYAGHQLIQELLHGGGSPYYETYFSGAPGIYSPLAAVADHFGGIAAVRLMSLVFMLVATCLLFATTQRLFGYVAGVAATSLFASLGLAHDIGVYANYDSLALMFLALAAYCAVRSQEGRWLLFIPLALFAANAAKYMTVLFDPVVISMAALQQGKLGWRCVARRALILGTATAALIGLAAYVAGSGYIQGIFFTTLSRRSTEAAFSGVVLSPSAIVALSSHWTGIIMITGAAALLLALLRERANSAHLALLAVLVAAGCLVTLEALHLHTAESMRQHDTFGAWFTAIAGGYALAALLQFTRNRARWLTAGGIVLALGLAWAHYIGPDRSTYEGGRVISARYSALTVPYLQTGQGNLLIGYVAFGLAYDNNINVPWWRLYDDVYLKYPIPGRGGDSHGIARGPVCLSLRPGCMYLEGPVAYQLAIRAHWFSFISMYADHYNSADDRVIIRTAEHTRGYIILSRAGVAPTWIYTPDYRHSNPAQAPPLPLWKPSPTLKYGVLTFLPVVVFAALGVIIIQVARRRRASAVRHGFDAAVSAGGADEIS